MADTSFPKHKVLSWPAVPTPTPDEVYAGMTDQAKEYPLSLETQLRQSENFKKPECLTTVRVLDLSKGMIIGNWCSSMLSELGADTTAKGDLVARNGALPMAKAVVICDQVEAAVKNRVVRRDVTRVLTPGTDVGSEDGPIRGTAPGAEHAGVDRDPAVGRLLAGLRAHRAERRPERLGLSMSALPATV